MPKAVWNLAGLQIMTGISLSAVTFVGRSDAPASRALQNAALGILASLVTASATCWIVVMVANQSDREAARMIVDAQKGSGYLATVTTSMAASHGRQNRF